MNGKSITNNSNFDGLDKGKEDRLLEVLEILDWYIESSINGIAIASISGKLIYANAALLKMLDYDDNQEIIDQSFEKFCIFDDSKFSVLEVLKKNSTWTGEIKSIRSDGTLIDVQISINVICDKLNVPLCLMIAVIEITKRKQAETALAKSEEFLRKVIDTSPNIVYVKDTDSRYVLVNKAMASFYQTTSDEIVGLNDFELAEKFKLNKALIENTLYDDQKVIETKMPKFIPEVSKISQSNEKRWFQVTKVPLTLNDATNYVLNISVNITQHKLADDALRESEEKYRKLVDNATEGILIVKDDKVMFANPMAEKILGYSKEELMQLNILDLVISEDKKKVIRMYSKSIKGKANDNFTTIEIKHKNGSKIIIQIASVQISWKRQYVTLNNFRDITALNQMQENMHAIQKMESISTLAGGIAHQFNNTLCGITGNIELMQLTFADDEKLNKYLNSMLESTKHMTYLTNQLLAYAQGGKYRLQVVSINKFIESTLSLVKHAMKRFIKVETELNPETTDTKIDISQLQMVFWAILNNARDAIGETTEKKGEICIATGQQIVDVNYVKEKQDALPGKYVYFSVKDNGKGMSRDVLDKIFDPFFTTKFHGRGLGMAAAYGIVKNHKGWIDVDSEKGKGTLVTVCLPSN